MLKYYLKIVIRNFLRNKSFSIITIAGLSIGLTTFLAIGLYVADEFSFDRFHEKNGRIFRAVINAEFDGQTKRWGGSPNLVAPTAMREIPEVDKATRIFHHDFGSLAFISTEKGKFSETELFYADPEIFDVFTIQMVVGSKEKVLKRPGTIILSERAAHKYFGNENPVGKILTVDNSLPLEVTGIYRDFPDNSYLKCQLIASFASNWFGQDKNKSWGNASFDTFFLLHEGVTQETVNLKIEEMLERNIPKDDRWFKLYLQPLLDIHLYSGDMTSGIDTRVYGDIDQIRILVALGLIVILIAAVNYMNLSTAQSQKRNKEVGISKTLGATYGQLNRKFYFEAFVFVVLSMLVSLIFFFLLIPFFNELTGKHISLNFIYSPWFWILSVVTAIVLTFLSSLYPAAYLSSFSPKSALQKTPGSGGQVSIRKGLVIFQFSILIILIISTLVFFKQMNFLRDKELGYNPQQVVAIMVSATKSGNQVASLKRAFEEMNDVVKVSQSQSFPGIGTSMRNIIREGSSDQQGSSLLTMRATFETLDVLDIKLIAGKTLPETKDLKDTTVQVVINKSTADYLMVAPEDLVGAKVRIAGFPGFSEVVGVTEDFHFNSLHQKITPFCFHNARTEGFTYLLVKVNTSDLTGTMSRLEDTFKKIIPSAFEYTFLDQHLSTLYQSEKALSNVMLFFASLAIFIACLGLYALSVFTAEQRIKEIGIRKVMGASVFHLMVMLSKDFMFLVLVALAIGIPLGLFILNNWLEGFAYRTSIDTMVFVLAGLTTILIAGITVSFESFKAATNNPVKSLRSE